MSGNPIRIERRRHERVSLDRPCKVRCASALLALPARTRDLSPGGALLEIGHERPLLLGDRIDVLVDWTVCGLVRLEGMVRATVVRVDAGDPQRVGVAFQDEIALPLAA